MDCSLPGSSVHGIFQARVLEWGATALPDSIVIKCPVFGGTMVSNGDYALLNFSVLVFSLITSSVVVWTKLTYTKNLKPC